MRKKLSGLFFVFFFFTHSISCLASHIFGGELLYTYVSDTVYKLTLTLYGDCAAATGSAFPTLYTATPNISISNANGTIVKNINLNPVTVGVEVSPVCPAQLSQTYCNGGTLPGVKKFVYSANVVVPDTSSSWQFVFVGEMGGGNLAGRSNNITNINAAGSTDVQIEADLNNVAGPNSSPEYSTIPTPFYCVNVLEQYNHGAIDPDGDSLSFSLVGGIDGRSGVNVSYINPYTPTAPLSTDSTGFGFNSLNGQMTFTPSMTQDGLVICKVSEYRGGVLVGTSEREMTFVVLNNCNGTPPNLTLGSVIGGKVISTSATGKNVINICVGTPDLSFAISVNNPDGDTTIVSNSVLPGGSTLVISNNNTATPSLSFNWATGSIAPGIYTFFVTVKNNHCPLSSTQTIAYTINVTAIPTLSAASLSPTQCVHQAYMQYNLAGGFLPRTLTILSGSTTILSYTDTTGIVKDSLPAGNYTLVAGSDPQCTTTISLAVIDSGTLPLFPFTVPLCKGDSLQPIYFPAIGDGAKITWYDSKNNQLEGPPVPNTSFVDTYSYYVSEQYKKCSSLRNQVTAIVHPLPVATIINTPSTICYGDTIYLEATGGTQYVWAPKDDILTDRFGKLYVILFTPETVTVNIADGYGCTDSASVSYSNIQQCCNFAYPNAFTPNGDGKNDGFRIITYGNMREFRLLVYNRFGQVVFDSVDPRQYWDGKFLGVPAEMGTYFYFVKGTCLTGNKIEYKGDVTLIR